MDKLLPFFEVGNNYSGENKLKFPKAVLSFDRTVYYFRQVVAAKLKWL